MGNLAFRSPRQSWLIIADDNPASGSDVHASGNNCRTEAEQERLERSLEERDVSSHPPVAKSRTGFFANIYPEAVSARSVGDGSFAAGATKTIALAC